MSRLKIYSFTFCFLVLFFPAIFSLGIRFIPNSFQPSLDFTQKVYEDINVSQPLIAKNDLLSGIGLSIKNPNLMNKKDIILSLYQGDNLVRAVTLNGQLIGDGNFVKFIFDPIKNSKGQIYQAVFSAPTAQNGDALELFVTQDSLKEKMIVKNKPGIVSLSMVTFYRPSSAFSLMVDIYKEWLGKFTTDKPFFIFYCTIILLGLSYLLVEPFLRKKVN